MSFDWSFAEDIWDIARRAEDDLLFIAGNVMGPSMERDVRSRITLGLVGTAENRQMRLNQLFVIREILEKASTAHCELGLSIKMGKVDGVFR